MISKSDLVILVVSCSALAVGVFRWHQNTQDVSAITIPASANSHVIVEPVQNSVEPIQNNNNVSVFKTAEVPDTSTNAASQTVAKALPQPVPVTKVVIGSNSAGTPDLGTHEVRSGDYLGKIASQYGTDVQTLRDLNKLNGSVIQIGQEILYPL